MEAKPQHERLMQRFQRLKTKNSEFFLYLDRKLKQDRYGLCIYKLKYQKTVETNIEGQANNKEGTANVSRS